MFVGAFGTLVGTGGGFILVPVLLLLYPDEDPERLTAISLLVVCLNAVSGSVAYGRQRRIDYRSAAWFAAGTLPGAVAGALLVGYIPRRAFDALFAGVLITLGVLLMLRSQSNAIRNPVTGRGVVRRMITDRAGNTFVYSFQVWKGVAISGGVGFISTLLGIGGGVVHVPVMTTVLHFPVHIATATSQLVLAVMTAEGTGVHIATGALGWNSDLGTAALLSAGAIPGAQVGALAARRMRGGIIIRVLAGALVVVGGRLALKAV